MKLRNVLLACVAAASLSASASAASWVYVGSWHVGDGPVWTSNPPVYSGQGAAALLFGGTASQYAISTIDSNPANINFKAFLDGWGDTQYFSTPAAQNYSLDTGGGGYNSNPGGGSAYSAYVLDHSCFNRYGNPGATCGPNEPGLNFAFRAVPEPASWALMITGFGLVGLAARRRRGYLTA